MKKYSVFLTAAVLIIAAATMSSCRKEDKLQTVAVAATNNALTAGKAGTVAYSVTAKNIADGEYDASVAKLPTGVSVQGKVTIAGNGGTLTLAGNTSTLEGTYSDLTLSIDKATSAAFTLKIEKALTAPVFTTQPVDKTVSLDGNVTFNVEVTGYPAPSLQWQRKNPDLTWSALTGETSATLTVANVAAELNDTRYRCIATNSEGNATSNEVTITIKPEKPVFTLQPVNAKVDLGGNVTFTVAVKGFPTPKLQWESLNFMGTWSVMNGETSTNLGINNVNIAHALIAYRCRASNSEDQNVISNVVAITINPQAPVFTTQPQSVEAFVGKNASFTVAATGFPPPTLRWQWFNSGIQTWLDLSDDPNYHSATFTLNGVTAAFNGNRYRCIAENSEGSVTSEEVTLTVLSIGSSYQGGKIAYIDATGQHGLIAAPSDLMTGGPVIFQTLFAWWNGFYTITGAITLLGSGQSNTAKIVASQGNTGTYAAKLCNDLILNGYDDWYLPSYSELSYLYDNRNAIGGFSSVVYWSSTELNTNDQWAWTFNFGTGQPTTDGKEVAHRVRAVRAF